MLGTAVSNSAHRGQSAIAIAHNAVSHARTKHIDIRYHYVREAIQDNVVVVRHCPTDHRCKLGIEKKAYWSYRLKKLTFRHYDRGNSVFFRFNNTRNMAFFMKQIISILYQQVHKLHTLHKHFKITNYTHEMLHYETVIPCHKINAFLNLITNNYL